MKASIFSLGHRTVLPLASILRIVYSGLIACSAAISVLAGACNGGAAGEVSDAGSSSDAEELATTDLPALVEGPDVVASGGCAALSLRLLKPDESTAELTVLTALTVVASQGVLLSGTPNCAEAGAELAIAMEAGPAQASLWARGIDVGTAEITVHSGAAQLGAFGLDVVRGFDASAAKNTALIVYNSNLPDSLALAQYYADARDIDSERLCGAPFAPGVVASADELMGARRFILEECICPLLPADSKPSPCQVQNASSIAAISPITHLVFIKGVPTRLTETGWTADDESASLAPFLSYLLYHDEPVFGVDSQRYLQANYPTQSPIRITPPALSAKDDGWAAYGYVEAVDNQATREMIDRTLSAEKRGFTGNILVEESTTSPLSVFLQELTSTFSQECFDYLSHTPFEFGEPSSSWPHSVCRYGTTDSAVAPQSGGIPGELGTTVPSPINVGLFLGTNPWPNTQVGFDGFNTMLRWHGSEENCTALCNDLPSPVDVAMCRAQSTDYFTEINSECVGVAEGFLGFQIRSWPVQYAGFYPSGWETRESGQLEKDTPRLHTGGGFTNDRFTDDTFVRFGQADFEDSAPAPALCETEDGGSQGCSERVVINMVAKVELDPPLAFINGEREFRIRVRYRNGASPPDGAIIGYGIFEGGGTDQWETRWVIIPTENPNWVTWEFTVTARQASLNGIAALENVALMLSSQPTPQPALDYVDFDGVEIIDVATGQQLLPADVGSFAATGQLRNRAGDFASNIIDRLGGVGSWGSTSHFVTGGWAYRLADRFASLFFAGRTLGEAILSSGRPQSGLIYGDPLYRPVAIRLSGAGGSNMLSIHDPIMLDGIKTLHATAMLGTGGLGSLVWTIDSCDDWDLSACEATWTNHLRGVGAIEDAEIDWTKHATLDTPGQKLTFRLRMWNPGEEEQALSSHLRIEFQEK